MKQKKWLTAVLATALLSAAQAQEKYVIEGTVQPAPKDITLHLFYSGDKAFLHDSAKVVNGKFRFEGSVQTKGMAYVAVPPDGELMDVYVAKHGGMPAYQIGVYLETGTISLLLHPTDQQSVVVKGTVNNDVMQAARAIVWKYNNLETARAKRLEQGDSVQKEAAVKEYYQIVKAKTVAMGEFIKAHPNALASLDLLKRWINPVTDLSEAKQYYAYLSDDLKASRTGMIYGGLLKQSARIDIDSIAPDFQLTDTAGTMHHLSDYKGKYVLIDFWASWCVPCLREMPHVVKAYDAFKNKNFEVIGVSLDAQADNGRAKWINAFKKAGMTWPQWSDLNGWSSAPAKLYMINSIPSNFLLNPAGKIIAKDLRGQDLMDALRKYL
ncbi:Peroxiredoxin [Filimonas lacunae]|uniref:Peroxiredoxin n=1 Tax=Filimonas lacunae TaxID=477680 RepID=A0A173MIR2_9BACT|nr:redoxin domain-containing protein [Filimonas lacunae]BAV07356.1 thiol:disulfide interchange protein [Filimonas lacunae]SIS90857.1 Peroxiredoxin [Filimonas lacunae]